MCCAYTAALSLLPTSNFLLKSCLIAHNNSICNLNSFSDPSTTSTLSSWFYLVYLIWCYYLSLKFAMWIVKQKIGNKQKIKTLYAILSLLRLRIGFLETTNRANSVSHCIERVAWSHILSWSLYLADTAAYSYSKNGPISASFRFIYVFSSLHNSINWWTRRWCAWDSNLGRQNGRHRRIHWAIAAPL